MLLFPAQSLQHPPFDDPDDSVYEVFFVDEASRF
jgi:hypothetical protein